MSSTIQLKRGTRAQITALAAKRGLLSGEPLLIIDENRLAVATDVNAFEAAAKQGETGSGSGTVTSVSMTVPTGLTVSGSPITSSGTFAVTLTSGYSIPTTANQTNWNTAYNDRNKWDGGSTGLVAATGRTSLGATTLGSNLFTISNVASISFLRFNADNTVSALDAATFRTAIGAGTSSTTGTVTSVTGTGTVSGLTLSGTVTSTGNLTLSGTLAVTPSNFASQTAKTFLAAPNAAAGIPTFRTIVASDIPTLNQNTTGTSSNVTGVVSITNGGTGATTASAALTALGAQAAATAITTSNIGSQSVSYATNAGNALLADGINGIIDITEGGTGASTATNARANLLPSYTGNAGKALVVNGTESDLVYAALGGTGTVTSVGISVPAFLAADNSPIITSGTIAIGFSGTALPVLNGGTGATSLTGVLIGNGTGAFTTTAQPSGSLVGTSAIQTLTNKTVTGLKETRIALPANNIDIAAGNYFTKTISTATTFTVSNVPTTGTTATFILDLTDGGIAAITWWSGVKWQGGTTPTLTASGRDVLGFFTHDAGVTWSGLLLAKDIK